LETIPHVRVDICADRQHSLNAPVAVGNATLGDVEAAKNLRMNLDEHRRVKLALKGISDRASGVDARTTKSPVVLLIHTVFSGVPSSQSGCARNPINASLTTGVTVDHLRGQVRSTDSLIPSGVRNPTKALVMTERIWELAIWG
jgi:hypothetical protein